MIVVRDVFQIDPEQMKKAKKFTREMREFGKKAGSPISRILTDLTGEYYTLILESEAPSLGDYEAGLHKILAHKEWQKMYPRFRKLIKGGRREIFTVVE